MKRKIIVMFCCIFTVLMLAACDASDLNATIEKAAGEVGVDVDINITQDQLDSVMDKAKGSVDTVKGIAEDEDVQKAAKDILNSVSDLLNEANENVKSNK